MNGFARIKMVFVLTLITGVVGALLSYVYGLTYEKIAFETRKDFLKGLEAVLPKYNNDPLSDIVLIDNKSVYIAKYDNKTVGCAVNSTSKKGYGGDVDIIVGVDNTGAVIGVEVLKHSETPGLGDKIKSADFLNLFKGLKDSSVIAVKKDGGVIDEFSGATISPRAVAEAVRGAMVILDRALMEGRHVNQPAN